MSKENVKRKRRKPGDLVAIQMGAQRVKGILGEKLVLPKGTIWRITINDGCGGNTSFSILETSIV